MSTMIKMKRFEAQAFCAVLGNLKKVAGDAKLDFSFAVSLTRRDMQPAVEAIAEIQEDFQEKYTELCESFAKKDDDGKPIVEDNVYAFEDQEAASAAVIELQKSIGIEAFMNEEIEVPVTLVSKDKAPDGLPLEVVEIIMPIFTEFHENGE